MRQLLRITATFALALVFTAGMAFGQDNFTDVEQVDGSIAEIDQEYVGTQNIVRGLGGGSDLTDGNAFTQEQKAKLVVEQAANGGTAGHLLEGEQLGGRHLIQLDQEGNSQDAFIRQEGAKFNRVKLRQKTATGEGNEANIFQNSNSRVQGGNAAPPIVTLTKRKRAEQDGADNDLDLKQRSGANRFYFEQVGDFNTIDMEQTQTSTAVINQDGNDNIVAGSKSGMGTFDSANAELYVTQSGDDVVYGGQTGSSHDVAYIDQGSGANEVELVQQ